MAGNGYLCDTVIVVYSTDCDITDADQPHTCLIHICKEHALHELLRSHTQSSQSHSIVLHYISLPITLTNAKHCLQYLSTHLEQFKRNPESTMYTISRDKIVHIKTLIEMLI